MHVFRSSFARRGFTLVELMISLGIALLLIYGINLVFRAVTDTVRVGNSLAAANRRMRSVDSSLIMDFEGTTHEWNASLPGEQDQSSLDLRWSGIVPITSDINPTDPNGYKTEPRQPAITIYCRRDFAFMNKADQQAQLSAAEQSTPWIYDENDKGISGTGPGAETDFSATAQSARAVNSRIHRLDTIGFFAGGSFVPRGLRVGTASTTSGDAQQAWIWYGHALQHNTTGDLLVSNFNTLKPNSVDTVNGAFMQPGEGNASTNPRNFYASDWALSRVAMLLLPRQNSTNTFPGIPTLGATSPQLIQQFWAESQTYPLPIDFNNTESRMLTVNTGASTDSIYSPAATINDGNQSTDFPKDPPAPALVPFTSGLDDVVGAFIGNPTLASGQALLPTGSTGTLATVPYTVAATGNGLVRRYFDYQANPLYANTWWQGMMYQGGTNAGGLVPAGAASVSAQPFPMRFNTVNAFSKPVVREGLLQVKDKSAMQSTFIARGCTQFIVEFAGDFYTQQADGTVGANPDGVLDFRINPVTGLRETQWYGLPRDVDGDGYADVLRVCDMIGKQATLSGTGQVTNQVYYDPATGKPTTGPEPGTRMPFEYCAGVNGAPNKGQIEADTKNYIVAFGAKDMYPAGQMPDNSVAVNKAYRPWLIRITVTLNDPSGALKNGLTREYVFKVR